MDQPAEVRVPSASGDVSRLAEHLFRHEAGKLVSVLTGIFGTDRLQLAEDVVQEALLRALQTWPYYGIPKNPAAWLTQTAKHLTVDLLRREKVFRDKQPQITGFFEGSLEGGGPDRTPEVDGEIHDERLRLMFACCHPLVPEDAQVALALRTLCGFSPAEIAKAFLTTEVAVAKRLTRARQKIRELKIPFEIPAGEELSRRLEAVLQTIYLLFNEGYKASNGDRLVKEDLCREAIRLGSLLAKPPLPDEPRTHALLALMCLNAARLPARVDAEGNILRLKEQDRASWNQGLIGRGLFHLAKSAAGNELTVYHLQAGIAACHCAAPSYEATDWARIVALYDQLVKVDHSPIIALNRAVALAQVDGPSAGLAALAAIPNRRPLHSYYLFHAVLAELEAERGEWEAAAAHLRTAIPLTELHSERTLLGQRLALYEGQSVPANR